MNGHVGVRPDIPYPTIGTSPGFTPNARYAPGEAEALLSRLAMKRKLTCRHGLRGWEGGLLLRKSFELNRAAGLAISRYLG